MKKRILINFLFILPISLILLVGIVILYFFNSSIEKLQTNIIEDKYVQLYTGDAKLDATETANIINLNYTLENADANYLFTYDKLVLSDYLYLNGEQKQLNDDTIYISDYIYLLGLQNVLPEAAISSFALTSYSQCAVNNVELNTFGYYKYGIKFKGSSTDLNVVVYETSYFSQYVAAKSLAYPYAASTWNKLSADFYLNAYVNSNTLTKILNMIVKNEDGSVRHATIGLDNGLVLNTFTSNKIGNIFDTAYSNIIVSGAPSVLGKDEFIANYNYILQLNGYDINNMSLKEKQAIDLQQFVGRYYDISFVNNGKTVTKHLKLINRFLGQSYNNNTYFDIYVSNDVFENLSQEFEFSNPINYAVSAGQINFINTMDDNYSNLLADLINDSSLNYEAKSDLLNLTKSINDHSAGYTLLATSLLILAAALFVSFVIKEVYYSKKQLSMGYEKGEIVKEETISIIITIVLCLLISLMFTPLVYLSVSLLI